MKIKYENFLFPLLVFMTLFGLAAQILFGWLYLHTTARFGDLLYVLEKVNCFNRDLYVARTTDPCTGYIYGSTLIKFLHLLGISAGKLEGFGFLLIILFTFIFFRTIYLGKLSFQANIFFFILYFSPPIVLLIERGNIDILICILIFLSGHLFTARRITAGVLILILAGMFKFYPIALALVAILLLARKKLRILLLSIWIFAFVIVVKDLLQLQNLPWDARNMFGNSIWGEYLNYAIAGSNTHGNFLVNSALGILIIFLMGFANHLVFSNRVVLKNVLVKSDIYFFSLFSGTYLICYFSGLNVDYRLVFLLIAITYINRIIEIKKVQAYVFTLAVCLTFFLSFNSNLLQPFGDLAQVYIVFVLISALTKVYFQNSRTSSIS